MSTSPSSDAVPASPPTFWAGPAMLTTDESSGGVAAETVPLLALWSQNSQRTGDVPGAGGTGPPGLPQLLERGFARLTEPEVAAVRALPRLDDAEVRLSADGAWFQLVDGSDALVTGELATTSALWRDTVGEADLLAVLVATQGQPDPPAGDDADRAVGAMRRLTAACAAGTLVGARLVVRVSDPESA